MWYTSIMKHNTSITLGSHFTEFVTEQVKNGRYSNTSEVVRSGLRLLEEREAKLAALRQALVDGEQSGIASDFDFSEFIATRTSA